MAEESAQEPSHGQPIAPRPSLPAPTMISVEVKVNGIEEEARVLIGIWPSAWHERVGQLGEEEGHRVITLPVAGYYCAEPLLESLFCG